MAKFSDLTVPAVGLSLLLALIIAGIVLELRFADEASIAGTKVTTLSNVQEKHVDVVLGQSTFLVTLSSTLVAAVAGLLFVRSRRPKLVRPLVIAAVMAAGASLYFGYRVYEEVGWALGVGLLLTDSAPLRWVLRLQFMGLLLAVLCALSAVFVQTEEA